METMHALALEPHPVYATLVGWSRGPDKTVEQQWDLLAAAHIVGQANLRLHLHSHCLMLSLAARTRDWPEVAGQVFRLVLVPLGHLANRLPAGNIGRATVSAFRPMPLAPRTRELLIKARQQSDTQAL